MVYAQNISEACGQHEGSPVDIIYLDFQKAFDKVPHQRLILKLKSHCIGISIINWIEQWRQERFHIGRQF